MLIIVWHLDLKAIFAIPPPPDKKLPSILLYRQVNANPKHYTIISISLIQYP